MQDRSRTHILPYLALFLVVGAAAGAYFYTSYSRPCTEPILYRIGVFDTQFGITRSAFVSAVEEGSRVWEDALGKELFTESDSGDLVINLIYDERQAETQEQQALESEIDLSESTYLQKKEMLAALKVQYEQATQEYEVSLLAFQNAVAQYQAKVSSWNRRGGAPKDEYEKMMVEKQEVLVLQRELESDRSVLNELGRNINTLIAEVNAVAQETNERVREYNESDLIGVSFDQGLYVRDASGVSINIYQFTDHQKLVRVLAHEFGHALGLEHNQNPESIMYALNRGDTEQLSPDDLIDLRTLCRVDQ